MLQVRKFLNVKGLRQWTPLFSDAQLPILSRLVDSTLRYQRRANTKLVTHSLKKWSEGIYLVVVGEIEPRDNRDESFRIS